MWTKFWDMNSGGGLKESPYGLIYIEAPEQEAKSVFHARFGHNPERVTCTCCGEDYSISEYETLDEATKYHRKSQTLNAYLTHQDILILYAKGITPQEKTTEVPEEGYVWI